MRLELILAAVVPALLLLVRVYLADRLEREPLSLLLGLIFLGRDLLRRRRLRIAWESGNCVEAEFLGVVTRRDVNTVNGQPRVVECAWTAPDGVVHVYRSRYLYTDVTKLLKDKKIPVYIDRYDENIGFVDIDAVLPEIRIHN